MKVLPVSLDETGYAQATGGPTPQSGPIRSKASAEPVTSLPFGGDTFGSSVSGLGAVISAEDMRSIRAALIGVAEMFPFADPGADPMLPLLRELDAALGAVPSSAAGARVPAQGAAVQVTQYAGELRAGTWPEQLPTTLGTGKVSSMSLSVERLSNRSGGPETQLGLAVATASSRSTGRLLLEERPSMVVPSRSTDSEAALLASQLQAARRSMPMGVPERRARELPGGKPGNRNTQGRRRYADPAWAAVVQGKTGWREEVRGWVTRGTRIRPGHWLRRSALALLDWLRRWLE